MLIGIAILLFLVAPFIFHALMIDVGEGSSTSALVVGVVSGLAAGWPQGSFGLFLLAFFFITALEFGYAHFIGSLYRRFGSSERRDYAERASQAPISSTRAVIPPLGLIAIALAFFASELVSINQTGQWEAITAKRLLGYCLVLLIGIAAIVRISMKKSSPAIDFAGSRTNPLRQLIFKWYVGVAIGVVFLAMAFGSKFTTPVHSTFLGGWSFLPLAEWGITCFLAGLSTGIVSAVFAPVHRAGSDIGKFAAGTLLFGGVCLYFAQIGVEGANVHFDSTPAIKVTAQILQIEPSPPGSKQGATLHLAYWGVDNLKKVVKARQNRLVFRMDLDAKNATFYVRNGYFGVPYAAEFR